MASKAPTSLFEGTFRAALSHADRHSTPPPNFKLQRDVTDTSATVDPDNPILASQRDQSARLFRSQSITDQINKTPRVTPHWGHSLSRSYGGNDWPLPASDSTTAASTPGSSGFSGTPKEMFSLGFGGDDPIFAEHGPKKRGPKPKNEPALTVVIHEKKADK
jgi:hypothetical protein